MNVRTKYYSNPGAETVEPEFKFVKVLVKEGRCSTEGTKQNKYTGQPICATQTSTGLLLEHAKRVNMPPKLWEIMDLRGPALFVSPQEASATLQRLHSFTD